jgi:hypothetical protein
MTAIGAEFRAADRDSHAIAARRGGPRRLISAPTTPGGKSFGLTFCDFMVLGQAASSRSAWEKLADMSGKIGICRSRMKRPQYLAVDHERDGDTFGAADAVEQKPLESKFPGRRRYLTPRRNE